MKTHQARLRLFAGPNGSGKSTIKSVIRPELLGVYINPDEIEAEIKQFDFLDLAPFGIKTERETILDFFRQSTLLEKAQLLDEVEELRFNDNKLSFYAVEVNSYFASVAADFIRRQLLATQTSFSFESVMSSPDKVELLKQAQALGMRTYLYFIATEDPAINIARVRNRVNMGGHPVSEEKIISRYYRTLDLLIEAVKYSHRAYIFDNSGHQAVWLAEITDGQILETKTDKIPHWFKTALWDKFQ